ncbi:MAG: serine/threonine protein phosphatase [Alphaproteobacteria bacterium]|nr:MAG: serine/threonine protein phosphatase [Alphaproteobacteria bacterium]
MIPGSRPRPRVPPGTRVYAIGDVHGCCGLLQALHRQILADGEENGVVSGPDRRRVVVYLGDYIDRGPDSRGLIDLLIETPLSGFETVRLMGNHEEFMLRFLESGDDPENWILNGGDATLRSYGLDTATIYGPAAALRAALAARLPAAHRRFLEALRLMHEEGDYLFVHAGVRPGVPIKAQNPRDLLWIREPFLSAKEDFGKVVVHGHTPVERPQVRANRIGIDTGACYGGALTALVLEGTQRRFLHT